MIKEDSFRTNYLVPEDEPVRSQVNDEKFMVTKSALLFMLVRCEEEKTRYKKNGYRYEEALKMIATYIFIVGGRILYDTSAANLLFPYVSTVFRYMNSSSVSLI